MKTVLSSFGLLVALLGSSSCDSKSAHENAPPPGGTVHPEEPKSTAGKLDQERRLISLSKTASSMTAMAFVRTTPPPWKQGNTLEFRVNQPPAVPGALEEQAIWSVINIHAENLFEITQRLGLDLLEMQIVHRRQPSEFQETGRPARKILADLGFALITDPRIPQEWLLSEPKGDLEVGRQLKAQYPAAFRKGP